MGSSSIFFSSQWSVNPCRAIDRSSNESSCPRRCSSNPKRKSKSKSKKKQNYHQAKTNKRTSSVGTYSPTYMKKKKKKTKRTFFAHTFAKFFSAGRWSFLALSAAGHEEGPRVHYGARLGPGRAPWRVLWASLVARAASASRIASRPTEPRSAMETQTHPCFPSFLFLML